MNTTTTERNDALIRGYRKLAELVPYTRQYLAQLEEAGQFPKKVKLGNGKNAACFWRLSEVQTWLEQRVAARGE